MLITQIQAIARVLSKGGVAVIPTDTIYGIVAQASNESAINKIYQIKNRAADKPSIVLIADFEQSADFGIDKKWLAEAKKYWPGPNSLIFPTNLDKLFLTKDKTIALRLPNNDELRQLIRQTGPLIAPSANPEGLPPAATIFEAKAYFGKQVDVYIDGGQVIHTPSKLIDLISHKTLR